MQDFIPLPMTGSAAMYVTGLDINTGKPIPVVRNAGDRERQKRMLRPNPVHEARQCGSRGGGGGGSKPMPATSGPQLDTVD